MTAERVKLSDIRAQFPMYADLNDEQLLIGLRKKFYADIPMKEFAARIEFDNQADPTEGMSEIGKLGAGYVAGLKNTGMGIGQLFGMVSRDDVKEARRLESPLMRTGMGKTGDVLGQMAALLPTAAIPGAATMRGAALIGAGTGLAAPSASTGETVQNTLVGGVAAPAALAAGRGIAAGWQGAKGLVQPLTAKGQDQIAASTLRAFAADPDAAAKAIGSARELVPGSRPTMAQASGDPGLARLEAALSNAPETGPQLAGVFGQQRAARLKALQNIAGTDEHYNAIKDARRLFAGEDYGKAMTAGIDQQAAQRMAPQIEALLKRPSMKAAQTEARTLAAESGQKIDDMGSIQGMDWLKKALDNQIDKASQVGSSVGKERMRAMVGTKNDLGAILDEIAPAYRQATSDYAAMSKQVNSMDVARDLLSRYQPALAKYGAGGRENAQDYARAMEAALESVRKSTGQNVPLSGVMPAGDINMLENVARDLGRKAAADDAARSVGSNTAQNLASQNLLRRTLGPTGMPQSWAEGSMLQTLVSPIGGLYKLGGAERKILDRIAQAATDPEDAARLLRMEAARNPKIAKALLEMESALPGAGAGVGLLALPAQQQ